MCSIVPLSLPGPCLLHLYPNSSTTTTTDDDDDDDVVLWHVCVCVYTVNGPSLHLYFLIQESKTLNQSIPFCVLQAGVYPL
jgi:hypothetical protein